MISIFTITMLVLATIPVLLLWRQVATNPVSPVQQLNIAIMLTGRVTTHYANTGNSVVETLGEALTNTYNLLEFFLMVTLLYVHPNRFNKFPLIVGCIGLASWLTELAIRQSITDSLNYTQVLFAVIYTCIVLLYFWQFFRQDDLSPLHKDFYFIISAGTLIYYPASILPYLMHDWMVGHNPKLLAVVYQGVSILHVVFVWVCYFAAQCNIYRLNLSSSSAQSAS